MSIWKQKTTRLVGLLGIIFFLIYSSFVVSSTLMNSHGQLIFNWPDEMANNFFIRNFVETGKFSESVPLNNLVENIIHPRSVNVLAGNLVPVGFLGLPIIYGIIIFLLGMGVLPFLTPFFAILGAVSFYGIIKRIFDEKIAFISYCLLLTLGTFWYHSSLVLLPNVLFVSLLLMGFLFLLRAGKSAKGKMVLAGFGGLFISGALIVRPVEFTWLVLILLILLITYRNAINWKQILTFILVGIIPASLLLYFNYKTYGSIFGVGYLRFQQNGFINQLPTEFKVSGDNQILNYLKLVFLPFGFELKLICVNLYRYFARLLWPYFILMLAGLSFFIFDWKNRNLSKGKQLYLIIFGIVGLWLSMYYGSWELADPQVLALNTISISYVRYWLILNILMLPIIADLLQRIKLLPKIKLISQIAIIVGLSLFSLNIVYRTPGDGLLAQRKTIADFYNQYSNVEKLISKDSLLIVDRADKLFFPDYQVITFNGDLSIFEKIRKLKTDKNIFYFYQGDESEINKLNEKIQTQDLKLNFLAKIDKNIMLYKLEKVTKLK